MEVDYELRHEFRYFRVIYDFSSSTSSRCSVPTLPAAVFHRRWSKFRSPFFNPAFHSIPGLHYTLGHFIERSGKFFNFIARYHIGARSQVSVHNSWPHH